MERLRLGLLGLAASLTLAACGNGGSIDFKNPTTPNPGPSVNGSSSVSIVPASAALAIEPSKTVATGYHAKLQINPLQSTEISGSGYTAKLKHTTRNR